MISVSLAVFWISSFLILYTYLGYGILLWLLTKFRKRDHQEHLNVSPTPPITHLIAAYNEEDIIEAKISNSIQLAYPEGKLETVVVTDGSTDNTPRIVSANRIVKHYHSPERKGKIHAVNRVIRQITSPIVVFSDANTILNQEALLKIARHYTDPKVGGVAGEKRIASKEEDNAAGSGEGLYWKYESFLKMKDSEFNYIVGAAGELFSVRTELYEQPDPTIIIEDFFLSLKIVSKGYRFLYEPEAYATETASHSVGEE